MPAKTLDRAAAEDAAAEPAHFVRVTWRDGGKRQTVTLLNPREVTIGHLGPVLIGAETDRDGNLPGADPHQFAQDGTATTRTRVISLGAVTSRVPLVEDYIHGGLVPRETAERRARAYAAAGDAERAQRPVRHVGVAGVAAWLGVSPDTVHHWILRAAGTTAPTPPPDVVISPGRGGSPDRGWADTPARRAEWETWAEMRPGQGRPGMPKPRHRHHEAGDGVA